MLAAVLHLEMSFEIVRGVVGREDGEGGEVFDARHLAGESRAGDEDARRNPKRSDRSRG
jgi:hypothetical protein